MHNMCAIFSTGGKFQPVKFYVVYTLLLKPYILLMCTVDFTSLRMSVCVKHKCGVLMLSVFMPRYL